MVLRQTAMEILIKLAVVEHPLQEKINRINLNPNNRPKQFNLLPNPQLIYKNKQIIHSTSTPSLQQLQDKKCQWIKTSIRLYYN